MIYRRASIAAPRRTLDAWHRNLVEDVGRIRNDISVESRRLPHTLPLGHGTHHAIAGLSDNNSKREVFASFSRCRQPVVAENPAQSGRFHARLSAVSRPASVCAREAMSPGVAAAAAPPGLGRRGPLPPSGVAALTTSTRRGALRRAAERVHVRHTPGSADRRRTPRTHVMCESYTNTVRVGETC